jgi:hypothetical protein
MFKSVPFDETDEEEHIALRQVHRRNSSFHWENEKSIEALPEQEFLTQLSLKTDITDIHECLRERMEYLLENDDAAKLNSLPPWKLAFYRHDVLCYFNFKIPCYHINLVY